MNSLKFIKPAVCIPIHTSNLNKYELISIKSHIFKLQAHDVFLLLPNSKVSSIISVLERNNIPKNLYRIHQVKDYCLKNSDNYQLLMLTINFYQFYQSYSHILIAQIDSYTFSDELIKWCRKDLDYIGAPCFKFKKYWTSELYFCGVGGFSLRNIKKTLELLEEDPIIFTFSDLREFSKPFNFKGKFILFLKFILTKLLRKDRLKRDIKFHSFTSKFKNFFIFINEDVCYAYYLPKYKKSFKVGNLKNSISFCIDWNVQKQLNNILPAYPFGAHAWFSYPENLNEWEKHIEEIK